MARSDDDDLDDDDLEDSGPPAKTSMLTLVLCFLNVAAAVGFAILLVLDFSKRQEWSYAVFLHDIAMEGLPLEEENNPTASRETRPKKRLTNEQLKAAVAKAQRGVKVKEFHAVEEVFPNRIQPQHLTDEILKDIFKDVGPPVKTLEDEIQRLKKQLPGDIQKAAEEVPAAEKTEADKRGKLAVLLLPLAATTTQVAALDKAIAEAPAAKLDVMLLDAAQRRMFADILAPLEMQRPPDLGDRWLEKTADFDGTKVDDLKSLLNQRLEAAVKSEHDGAVFYDKDWGGKKRDSIDKRSAIAYILFTIAHARKPDGKLLYENGIDRARVVVGWHEFALAAQALTQSLDALRERAVQAIRHDRQGAEIELKAEHYQKLIAYYQKQEQDNAKNKKKLEEAQDHLRYLAQMKDTLGPAFNPGFTQRQRREIDNNAAWKAILDNLETRHQDLQDQLKKQMKIGVDRQVHLDDTLDRLLKSRDMTAKEAVKVRVLQEEYFKALRELKDADETNFRLLQEIGRLEGVRGGRP